MAQIHAALGLGACSQYVTTMSSCHPAADLMLHHFDQPVEIVATARESQKIDELRTWASLALDRLNLSPAYPLRRRIFIVCTKDW